MGNSQHSSPLSPHLQLKTTAERGRRSSFEVITRWEVQHSAGVSAWSPCQANASLPWDTDHTNISFVTRATITAGYFNFSYCYSIRTKVLKHWKQLTCWIQEIWFEFLPWGREGEGCSYCLNSIQSVWSGSSRDCDGCGSAASRVPGVAAAGRGSRWTLIDCLLIHGLESNSHTD